MSFLQTRAVVLNVIDYGESDKIVTFFTEQYGKIKGIAKGAKRSKKRFVNKLEYFTFLDLTLVQNKRSTLSLIDSATLINHFSPLREKYQRYCSAMLVCELIEQWTRENDSDEPLFHLLTATLDALTSNENVAHIVIFFHVKLLNILGLDLQLEHCLSCGLLAPSHTFYFSPNRNGIICNKCSDDQDLGKIHISKATVKTLHMAQALPWEKITRLKFSPQSLKESARILRQYSQFHLQRDIHSWKQFDMG